MLPSVTKIKKTPSPHRRGSQATARSGRHAIEGSRNRISLFGVRSWTLDVLSLEASAWCLTPDVQGLRFGASCLMFELWCLRFEVSRIETYLQTCNAFLNLPTRRAR